MFVVAALYVPVQALSTESHLQKQLPIGTIYCSTELKQRTVRNRVGRVNMDFEDGFDGYQGLRKDDSKYEIHVT